MPYIEHQSETFFPDSAIPIFLNRFIQAKVSSSELPKKFLIYSPNLLTISPENHKYKFENTSTLDIVSFVNSEKCDLIHDEIYQKMKECYAKLSIKTRWDI